MSRYTFNIDSMEELALKFIKKEYDCTSAEAVRKALVITMHEYMDQHNMKKQPETKVCSCGNCDCI